MKLIGTMLALAVVAGFSAVAAAQGSHESHHPAGDQPKTAAPAPSNASGGDTQASGMMGNGSMMGGQGMISGPGQGMMGGRGMMPMMQMMANMMGPEGMSEMAMPGLDMADYVEGRIAFLRTELKITAAQKKPWDAFAQALRDNAKKLGNLRTMAAERTGTPTLVQRLDRQEQWYKVRLDGIRTVKITFSHLYSALSDEQKKTADQILPPHLGLMPMMAMPMGMVSMMGQARGGMPMGAMEKSKP